MSEIKMEDIIDVIMNPLNFVNPDKNYEIIKILTKWNCVHVFILEYPNVYWNIKFRKSLIESIKEMLERRKE